MLNNTTYKCYALMAVHSTNPPQISQVYPLQHGTLRLAPSSTESHLHQCTTERWKGLGRPLSCNGLIVAAVSHDDDISKITLTCADHCSFSFSHPSQSMHYARLAPLYCDTRRTHPLSGRNTHNGQGCIDKATVEQPACT